MTAVYRTFNEYERACHPNARRERIMREGTPQEVADLIVEEALATMTEGNEMTATTCSDCEHPAHPEEPCEHIPWDGNPYGLDCGCPSDAEKRA